MLAGAEGPGTIGTIGVVASGVPLRNAAAGNEPVVSPGRGRDCCAGGSAGYPPGRPERCEPFGVSGANEPAGDSGTAGNAPVAGEAPLRGGMRGASNEVVGAS